MTLTLLEAIGVVGLFGGGVVFLWRVLEGMRKEARESLGDMRKENRTAHDGITTRIEANSKAIGYVDGKIETVIRLLQEKAQ